jgi:rSAM/selenodomain-associated transferase 1
MRELLIFLKAPRPGTVKTRLAAVIGDDLATSLYRAMASAVLQGTEGVPAQRRLCFTPRDAALELAEWWPGECLEPQTEGDLGARMDGAFGSAFERGAVAVVLIGTDALAVDRVAVEAGFDALREADVALRAARDGGYTLIGLRRPQPELFRDIAWSTGDVLEKTLARAASLGLRVALEGPDTDIDTVADVEHQREALRERLDPELMRRLEAVLERLPSASRPA